MSKPKQKSVVREWFRRQITPGMASDHIHHLPALLKERPGLKAIGYVRVSTRAQELNDKLDEQEAELRQALEELGVPVLKVVREAVTGRYLGEYGYFPQQVRTELDAAFCIAKAHNANGQETAVVALTRDRILRGRGSWDRKTRKFRPDREAPTLDQYDDLEEMKRGVLLATVVHPDAPAGDIRSLQTKRGQQAKGNKGGRPQKKKPGATKARRERELPTVRRLYHRGCGVKMIARRAELGLARVKHLVRYWCGDLYEAHARSRARRRQS